MASRIDLLPPSIDVRRPPESSAEIDRMTALFAGALLDNKANSLIVEKDTSRKMGPLEKVDTPPIRIDLPPLSIDARHRPESSPEIDRIALFAGTRLDVPTPPIRYNLTNLEEYKIQIFLALQTPIEHPGNPALHLRSSYYLLKEATDHEIKEWIMKVIRTEGLPEDLVDFFVLITTEALHTYRGPKDKSMTAHKSWKPLRAYGDAAIERLIRGGCI